MSSVLEEVFEYDSKIYLDYNGTTPVADEVQKVICDSLKQGWGNPSTTHKLGQYARASIEKARSQVAYLVNGNSKDVIFTSGGTEANNMVFFGLCQNNGYVKHVITTNVEHDSVALPLKYLAKTQGLQITEVDASDYERMTDNVIHAIRDNTALITIMAANNETGVIFPIKEIGSRLALVNKQRSANKLAPVIFHSDAAQILGKAAVNVEELQVDCMTIVGHKFYGPRIGALWSKVKIPPLLFGGGNQDRPGTENTPMIVGLGAAADLAVRELEKRRQIMEVARNAVEQNLSKIARPNCSNLPRLVNTSSLSFDMKSSPFTGRDLLQRCQRVLAGVGAACHANSGEFPAGSKILLNSGVPPQNAISTLRLSFGFDSSEELVNAICKDLKQAYSKLFTDSQ